MSDIENLTIMFTDIVGFSNMVSSMSRTESEKLLNQHNKLLQKTIKQFRGQMIKSVGDSFLVVFRSPTDAALCAMAMQDILWERNQSESIEHKINIRIALNTGEVRLAKKDIFGEAVNIASRLESNTPANAIYLTESVYLSMNKNELELESVGKFDFKGIRDPIHVYQVQHKKTASTEDKFSAYPYGGAHYQLTPASRQGFGTGKLFIGLTTALVTAVCSWWATIVFMPSPDFIEMDKIVVEYRSSEPLIEDSTIDFQTDITQEIRSRAFPLVKENNFLSLKTLISEYINDYPDNAYLTMLQGHVDMYYKKYSSAITYYQQALEKSSGLSWDPSLAKNLVLLLDHDREKTNQLLGNNLSKPIVKELSSRTGKPGLRARYDAFYLLKDSGNLDKVDVVGLNVWDLRELNECRLKHVAVKELKRLKDTRALPALEEVVDVNLWKQLQYTCLRKDAKQAIALITGKDEKTNEPDKSNESKPENSSSSEKITKPTEITVDETNTAGFDKSNGDNLTAF